jgi:hypothetical protein
MGASGCVGACVGVCTGGRMCVDLYTTLERERERGRERERERTKVRAIIFLNRPGQNEKSV